MFASLSVLAAVLAGLATYTRYKAAVYTRRFPPTGRFETVDGVRLHFVDRPPRSENADPADPALVFVHGASGNLGEPLRAFGDAFDGRYRRIFIDRPGHGHSQRGAAANASPAAQAKLLDRLLERLGVERAILIGHSWGGSVAAAFGVLFKPRTAGLVFIAPATHPWEGGITFYYTLTAMPVAGWLFTRFLSLPIAEVWMGPALRSVFAPEPVPAGYLEDTGVQLVLRPREFRANACDVAELHTHVTDLHERYREIEAPSVIVTGDRDGVVYAEIHSEGLYRDIPDARLIELAGAGHMPHHTRTAVVVALIEEMATTARRRDAAE